MGAVSVLSFTFFSVLPSTVRILEHFRYAYLLKVRLMYLCSWSDPTNLRIRELRTDEKRGMTAIN